MGMPPVIDRWDSLALATTGGALGVDDGAVRRPPSG
jgi:hypothetical protein